MLPSFLISLLALNKIGAIAVLINTSLTGDPLVHCINSSDAVKCIVGAERAEPLEGVLNQINITKQEDFLWAEDTDQYSLPDWAIDLKAQLDFEFELLYYYFQFGRGFHFKIYTP